jgi:AmiR/NasT family two-component response regulator
VHQATGMIQAQLDTTATDAFLRLRARAFASGVPVDEVAREIVARRLTFQPAPE